MYVATRTRAREDDPSHVDAPVPPFGVGRERRDPGPSFAFDERGSTSRPSVATPPARDVELDRLERLDAQGLVAGVHRGDEPVHALAAVDLNRFRQRIDDPEVRDAF